MTNFIETFKAKAKAKNLSSADMIALCIYKTIKAKNEDKALILKYYLTKSFSAGKVCSHRTHPYQAVSDSVYSLNRSISSTRKWNGTEWTKIKGMLLDVDISDILDEETEALFRQIVNMIDPAFVKGL
jgi:hypothetical protein